MKSNANPAARSRTFPLPVLLLLVLPLACASEPPPKPASPDSLTIREVLRIPGFTADELFEGAKVWVANGFSSSLDVIRYANRQEKTVLGQAKIPHARPGKFGTAERMELKFTILVETRDDRLRYTFADLALVTAYGSEIILEPDMETIRPRLDAAVEALAASFRRTEEAEAW